MGVRLAMTPADAEVEYFADLDDDGYGNPGTGKFSWYVPMGYVTNDTDCDDADGAVNPAAVEIADGLDNDCEGSID